MKAMTKIIGLLLVLGILGGVAYWDEWQTERETKEKENLSKVFIDLAAKDIISIQIESKIEDYKLTLEKQSGNWTIVSPLSYLADQEVVAAFLKQVVDLKFEKSLPVDTANRLKDFGLDNPEISVTLNKDAKLSLALGLKTPVGYNRYMRVGGSGPVKVVGGYLGTALNKKIHEFRDKTIQMPSQNNLKQLTLINNEEVPFTRVDGEWKLGGEKNLPIDEDAFSQFMGYWRNNIIEEFIDKPSSDLAAAIRVNTAGTSLVAALRWIDGSGQDISWQFLENNDVLYGRMVGQEALYKISSAAKDQLQKTLWDFQYKKIADFNSTEVQKVKINDLLYVKKNNQWVAPDDSVKEFVASMLLDVEYANALEIKPLHEVELAKDRLQFSVLLEMENNSQIEFEVYKHPKEPASLWVRLKSSDQVFVVSDSFVDNFTENHLAKSEDDDSQG